MVILPHGAAPLGEGGVWDLNSSPPTPRPVHSTIKRGRMRLDGREVPRVLKGWSPGDILQYGHSLGQGILEHHWSAGPESGRGPASLYRVCINGPEQPRHEFMQA